MKALIATFSQTGTTLKVAQHIADGLKNSGWEVDFFQIKAGNVPNLQNYDLLGIGSPTYYYRPPYLVTDFIDALPDLAGKGFFSFVMYGTTQGACGNIIRKKLLKKHATDRGYFRCTGADYHLGYLKRGVLFSSDSPLADELAAAREFGIQVASNHRQRLANQEPYDPSTHWMYAFERHVTHRLYAKFMYSRFFRADKRCNACNICVKACPTGNISLTARMANAAGQGSPHPKWGNDCLLCLSCELKCPKNAIHSPYDWAVFAPFFAYNVRRGIREAIPYATVRHSYGKTERI